MQIGMKKPWNPELYDRRHSFVWKAAEDLVKLLHPRPGERILDVGCGTGHLTHAIASAGASVLGIDVSDPMLEEARRNYPDLTLEKADASEYRTDTPFDAVFSNAALHWMTEPRRVTERIHDALRPGGRFVAELGGAGNLHAVHGALAEAIRDAGFVPLPESSLLYFPTLGQYASLLEACGFRVTHGLHFDRPTRLPDGDGELRNWIAGFADRFLAVAPAAAQEGILRQVEDRLRPTLHYEGAWHADYVRLRIQAVKPR